ncbi:YopX family protein [Staphylococcus borealis]|uniref:YopX family protein n=1 Tax=Staphylococcus borealis TaxID=2742203 RepID=UPI0025A08785|nr:YopX family protein [Staphylococcus borealis]MDM7881598.1 YopX family protein [Staphylococcus borealis]
MENISFRAWDKDHKYMEYTDKNLIVSFGDNGNVDATDLSNIYSTCNGMQNFELMQSTGLKDKNGTEIYEGDVVALKYPYDKRIKTKGSIVWDRYKSCFGISMKETTERYELYRITAENYLTVIGNKYQHPELLEDE